MLNALFLFMAIYITLPFLMRSSNRHLCQCCPPDNPRLLCLDLPCLLGYRRQSKAPFISSTQLHDPFPLRIQVQTAMFRQSAGTRPWNCSSPCIGLAVTNRVHCSRSDGPLPWFLRHQTPRRWTMSCTDKQHQMAPWRNRPEHSLGCAQIVHDWI